MNYYELNNYIKHYIEKDKTQSAIMLTGAWGTGKSYYIRNVLDPFLREAKNGKHRCAIVSLYGLKDVSEISKRIYFELRSIGVSKKSEITSTGKVTVKIVAKTILNGVTNMVGFDIGHISDEDLEKVYLSIDLSNKLIILEDIERSNIETTEIFGYVNSLVEQDGAKVILVANEEEILNHYKGDLDENNNVYETLDKDTHIYLKSKEKTISDTIAFNVDLDSAIIAIISSFDNSILNRFRSEECVKNISEIMMIQRCYNLRLFIFACQKIVDIYERMTSRGYMGSFSTASIFYSVVALSLRRKNGSLPDWNTESNISMELGFKVYPLYRFCYDYVKYRILDEKMINLCLLEQERIRILNKNSTKGNSSLKIIRYFYLYKESEILYTLKNIENNILQKGYIGIQSYDELAYYLIKCNTVLGYDYSKCKQNMVKFLANHFNEGDALDLFQWSDKQFELESEKKQYNDFLNELKTAIKPKKLYTFSYNHEKLKVFYEHINNSKNKINTNRAFIRELDLDKLVKMIFECSSYELYYFRISLLTIYNNVQNGDILTTDFTFMINLKSRVENELRKYNFSLDKIQIHQINLLIKNISEFIKKLS